MLTKLVTQGVTMLTCLNAGSIDHAFLQMNSADIDRSTAHSIIAMAQPQTGLSRSVMDYQANPESAQRQLPVQQVNTVQQNAVISNELVAKIQTLAESGNSEAQFLNAMFYYYGIGVAKDPTQAISWYEAAGRQGVPEALTNLGNMYDNGTGVQRDTAKAKMYFEQAAKLGCAAAAFNLGNIYMEEKGPSGDPKKCFYWYKQAAKDNFLPALFKLSYCYETGFGTEKNVKCAVALLTQAADANYIPAQVKLARVYESGSEIGKDPDLAASLYLKAAFNGSPEALARIESPDFVAQTPPKKLTQKP